MSIFEIVLVGGSLILWLLLSKNITKKVSLGLIGFLLLSFVVHLVIDGWRMQMLLCYLLIGYLIFRHIRKKETSKSRGLFFKIIRGIMFTLFIVFMVILPSVIKTFSIPEPLGEHNVGAMDIEIIDDSRFETFTEDQNDKRRLMARVWYPTDDKSGELISYRENAFTRSGGIQRFLISHLDKVKNNAFKNASLSKSKEKYPIIIYSHGLNMGSRETSAFLNESLASFGFIVFSVDHPHQSFPVQFSDKSIAHVKRQDRDPTIKEKEREFIKSLSKYQNDKKRAGEAYKEMFLLDKNVIDGMEIWKSDLVSLLNQIGQFNQNNSLFKDRLDITKIGVAGFSYGGAVAVEFCEENPECKAVINHDGAQFGNILNAGVTKPFMFMTSEPNRWMNNEAFINSSFPGYQMDIGGTNHLSFTDIILLSPDVIKLLLVGRIKEHAEPADGHKVIILNTVNFFEKYLLNNEIDLLKFNEGFKNVTIEKNEN